MRVAAAILAISLVSTALPAAPDPDRKATRESGQKKDDAYILSLDDHFTSSGGDMEISDVGRTRERLAGDFLWFRRGGKTYRVGDAATLAKADALFLPMRALEPEYEDLRRKERQHDAREDELDREEELIEQDLEDLDADEEAGLAVDDNARRNLETRRDAVRSRMRDVEGEQRALESVERALDSREEALEAEAEGKLWRLIDEAIANGKAQPVPR